LYIAYAPYGIAVQKYLVGLGELVNVLVDGVILIAGREEIYTLQKVKPEIEQRKTYHHKEAHFKFFR
jgi:hypothetical protein